MKPVNFYEVTEKDGKDAVWGGTSALDCGGVVSKRTGQENLCLNLGRAATLKNLVMVVDKIDSFRLGVGYFSRNASFRGYSVILSGDTDKPTSLCVNSMGG
jgi:hypothetical protein